MRVIFIIIVLVASLVTMPAVADEDGVYESLRKIPIGRIFLTAQERASLDMLRGQAPIQQINTRPADDEPEPASDIDPAGFIVSDSGTTRVWKDGDFVATASVSEIRFPGDVRISSQPAQAVSEHAQESDETEESSVGARDDEE